MNFKYFRLVRSIFSMSYCFHIPPASPSRLILLFYCPCPFHIIYFT